MSSRSARALAAQRQSVKGPRKTKKNGVVAEDADLADSEAMDGKDTLVAIIPSETLSFYKIGRAHV